MDFYSKHIVHHRWIGAHNLDSEPGDWRWLNDDPIDETLWYRVAPKECGALCTAQSNTALHSFDCTIEMSFVCQLPQYCPQPDPPTTSIARNL
jgi:hypothetical protein